MASMVLWGDQIFPDEPARVQWTSVMDLLPPGLADDEPQRLSVRKAMIAPIAATALLAPAVDSMMPGRAEAQIEEPAPAPSVVYIGDSVGVGLDQADFVQKLGEKGVDVLGFDVKGARPLIQPGCDLPVQTASCLSISDGLRVLEAYPDKAAKADVIAISLGINDSGAELADRLERVARRANELGSVDGRQPLVLIPDMFYTKNYAGGKDVKNQIIDDTVGRLASEGINIRVVEQDGVVSIPMGDGVHPTGSGYEQLADFQSTVISGLAIEFNRQLYPPKQSAPPAPVQEPPAMPEPAAPVQPLPPNHAPSISFADFAISRTPTRLLAAKDYFRPQPVMDLQIARTPSSPAAEQSEVTARPALDLTITPVSAPTSNESDFAAPTTINLPKIEETFIEDRVPVFPAAPNVPIVPVVPAAPVVEAAPNPVPEALPGSVDYSTMYSIDENHVLDDSKLQEHIRSGGSGFRFAAPSEWFPEGEWVRIPDNLPGFSFANHTTHNERFASVEAAANLLIMVDWARKHGVELEGHDFVSKHREHLHGYDMDIGLFADPALREQFLMDMSLLRRPDGTPFTSTDNPARFPHIVTGDAELESIVEDHLNHLDYDRPNIITQEDHGDHPGDGDAPHLHFSGDGGASGPFGGPPANVSLNDPGIAPLLEIGAEPEPEPIAPTQQVSPRPTPILDVVLPGRDVEVKLPAVDDLVTDEKPKFPGTENDKKDKPSQDSPEADEDEDTIPVSSDQPGLTPTTNPDDTSIEPPAADDHPPEVVQPQEPIPEEPTPQEQPPNVVPPSAPAPDQHPESDAPMRDVFTDEVVQQMLPGAPLENIQSYTPLLLNALSEFGIGDEQMACYAFATIRPETGGFDPIPEIGKGKGKQYGVPDPETGHSYYGRGFIQLTWRSNYEAAGAALGLDLVKNPDLALEPTNAARIMAWYLSEPSRQERIRKALDENGWDLKAARQVVNGEAAHGLGKFSEAYEICNHVISQVEG